jgi:hypothetical protein
MYAVSHLIRSKPLSFHEVENMKVFILVPIALLYTLSNSEARPRHHHHQYRHHVRSGAVVQSCWFCQTTSQSRSRHVVSSWARPRQWCGWYMRHRHAVADPGGNKATWWARWGRAAHGPAVGTIVVWRNHVGEITGRTSDGAWIVLSGNDDRTARERPRSLAGAIAFRWPS